MSLGAVAWGGAPQPGPCLGWPRRCPGTLAVVSSREKLAGEGPVLSPQRSCPWVRRPRGTSRGTSRAPELWLPWDKKTAVRRARPGVRFLSRAESAAGVSPLPRASPGRGPRRLQQVWAPPGLLSCSAQGSATSEPSRSSQDHIRQAAESGLWLSRGRGGIASEPRPCRLRAVLCLSCPPRSPGPCRRHRGGLGQPGGGPSHPPHPSPGGQDVSAAVRTVGWFPARTA